MLRADGPARSVRETLAGEEPLEIRVNGKPLTVTMRTPGADFDLVAGNLLAEGLVRHRDELVAMRYAAGAPEPDRFNIVDAIVPGLDLDRELAARRVVTTGACGICGTTSLGSVLRHPAHQPEGGPVDLATLLTLPARIRQEQKLFEVTGGVHAAGLFTLDGTMLCLREDIGRHNAVDKVVGWALREGLLPLRDTVLQVSGRASFELVQKASLAGIPILAAVSAPSSFAVDHAQEVGLTLAGFSRGDRVTVYTHPHRIANGAVGTDPAAPTGECTTGEPLLCPGRTP